MTLDQHREISARMAVRIVHWLMDNPILTERERLIVEDYKRGVKCEIIQMEHQTTYKTIKNACIKARVPLRKA